MILVTGGTGFIGSHLLDRLSAEGQPARALVRRKTELPKNVEAVRADLMSSDGLANAVRGVSTIVHLAGVVSSIGPAGYEAGNVRATENLARAAAGQGIRLVVVSSLAACGPCPTAAPLTEDSTPAPITSYGSSKLAAEEAARAIMPETVVVRPPVVYGPRDKGVYSILKPICQGIAPRIGRDERWFSMVYVDDLVDGILAAARAPQAAGRTYFVTHPQAESWGSLTEAVIAITKRKPRLIILPRAAAFAVGFIGENLGRVTGNTAFITREKVTQATQTRWVCSAGRASAELGFEARTPFSEGLTRTLAWYKEAGWLKY